MWALEPLVVQVLLLEIVKSLSFFTMKKYLFAIVLLILPSLSFAQNMTFDDGTTWNCDQNFDPVPLRYHYQFRFFDTWNNPANVPVYMNDYAVRYKDSSYLRTGQSWPNGKSVYWTNQLKNNNYAVPANSSMEVISTFTNDWAILNHPETRTGNDFTIAYKINYDFSNNFPDTSDDISHVECQPYYITWCGDGVLDSTYEQCDLGAQNGQAGSACSATCQTVAVTPPVCNPAVTGTQPNNPLTRDPYPTLCNVGTASDGQTTGNTSSWKCNNGSQSVTCSANWSDNPPNPVCSTSVTGPQSSPLTTGACNAGSVYGFQANTVGNTTNYTWSCYNPTVCPTPGTTVISPQPEYCIPDSCSASYTPPPVCVRWSITLPLTSTITAATPWLCRTGENVTTFTATPNGTTRTDYTWSCAGSAEGGACAASYDTSTTPSCNSITVSPTSGNTPLNAAITCNTSNATTVSIACWNGQTINSANGTCNYTTVGTFAPRCTVDGTISPASCVGSVTTTPPPPVCVRWSITLPLTSTITAATPWLCRTGENVTTFTATPNGTTRTDYTWSCAGSAEGGACAASYDSNICRPWTTVWPQIVPVYSTTPNLCPTGQVVGAFTETIVWRISNYSWSCNGSPVGWACTASYNRDDPRAFNLSVKKYIWTDDAQTVETRVSARTDQTLTYQIVVKNEWLGRTSGVTTMQDILPTGVELRGLATWTNGNWNCTYTAPSRTVLCTNSLDQVDGWANLGATILIPVTVTATSGQVLNISAIDNPNESGRCLASGWFPTDAASSCTLDVLNSDPAYFYIWSEPNGFDWIWRACDTSKWISVCITYKTYDECVNNLWKDNCRYADTVWQNWCKDNPLLNCGPGGGGGWGECWNGVLEADLDEECDVVWWASWCVNCKIACLDSSIGNCTNPGENGIDDMWMTIPSLSKKARVGYTWLDGIPGKIPFRANAMVFGLGTKAFTLADTVGYGIKPDLEVPLVIRSDKDMCLESWWVEINSEKLCTTFGEAAKLGTPVTVIDSQITQYGQNIVWTRPLDSKEFVVLWGWSIYYQTSTTWLYYSQPIDSSNSIEFFKWAREYRDSRGWTTRLSDAFIGKQAGENGSFSLLAESFDINTDLPSGFVNLVSLPVHVRTATLWTTATPVNRKIENFLSQASLRDFLTSIRSSTSLSSTTNNLNNASSTATINLNIWVTGNKIVANMSQLEAFKLNGNKNILAIKGDLTLESCAQNTFVMDGVRSVIVEGNLYIKCNVVYGSSDNTSSFAWIVKWGNIYIDSGIENNPASGVSKISGIYITIGTNTTADCTTSGHFCPLTNTPSQKILRVEGSLYGNAQPLLSSRLYSRGTSAYEILTTGTILTYSNRALVNPPPLLSEYLSNYNVERVVR